MNGDSWTPHPTIVAKEAAQKNDADFDYWRKAAVKEGGKIIVAMIAAGLPASDVPAKQRVVYEAIEKYLRAPEAHDA